MFRTICLAESLDMPQLPITSGAVVTTSCIHIVLTTCLTCSFDKVSISDLFCMKARAALTTCPHLFGYSNVNGWM